MLPIWPPSAKALFLHQLKFANSKPKAAAVSYRSSSSSLASSSLSSATNASSASGARGPSGSLPAHNRPLVKTFLCNFAQDHQGFCRRKVVKTCPWHSIIKWHRTSAGGGWGVGSRQHVCQLPFELGRRRHPRHYMSREPTRVPRIPDRETAEPASVSVLRDLRHLQRNTERAVSSCCSNTKGYPSLCCTQRQNVVQQALEMQIRKQK